MTSVAFALIVTGVGEDLRLSDRGDDVFDRANIVVDWAGERAAAARAGLPLPDPPELYANIFAVKVGFSTTLVHEVMLGLIVALMIRRGNLRHLRDTFKLNQFDFNSLWVPVVSVIAVYAATTAYIMAVRELGIDILVPRSNVPSEVVRDPLALAMAGVLALLAAPLFEEMFFRGLMVTGLLKYGAWPAIAIPAMIFAVLHFSIGAVIPIFLAGATLGWLYWRRGNLWDSITFHFLFNATSYVILLGTR